MKNANANNSKTEKALNVDLSCAYHHIKLHVGDIVLDRVAMGKGIEIILSYPMYESHKSVVNLAIAYKGDIIVLNKIFNYQTINLNLGKDTILSIDTAAFIKAYYSNSLKATTEQTDKNTYTIPAISYAYCDHFVQDILEKQESGIKFEGYKNSIDQLFNFLSDTHAMKAIGKEEKLRKDTNGNYLFPTKNVNDEQGNIVDRINAYDIELKRNKDNTFAIKYYKNKI